MIRSLLAAVSAVVLTLSSPAQAICPALSAVEQIAENKRLTEFTVPHKDTGISYIAVVDLCRREPETVLCSGRQGRVLSKAEVVEIDASLRRVFTYRTDETQYKKIDYWTSRSICGDCEDYALYLSERLAEAGASGASMRLEIWEVIPGLGHATLVVDTTDAGKLEISVGGMGVSPYDPAKGERLGWIVMDGQRTATKLNPARLFGPDHF